MDSSRCCRTSSGNAHFFQKELAFPFCNMRTWGSYLKTFDVSLFTKSSLTYPENEVYPNGFFIFQEEDEAPKAVKTDFTVKLMKYDEKQKVALIKEIKNLLEGMNLVQVST